MSKIYVCALCGKEMKNFVNPMHLRVHGITKEKYLELDPTAIFTLATAWNKGLTKETDSSMAKASESHKTQEYRERYEASMMATYGVRHPSHDPDTVERIVEGMKRTNLQRYGVENYGQTEEGRKQTAEIGRASVAGFHRFYRETGYRTIHEKMFHEMHPTLACNKAIGTGKGGTKKYGTPKFVPDFIDEVNATIYEIDGSWHERPEKRERDAVKTSFYESKGYRVVRYTPAEVQAMYDEWLAAQPHSDSREQDIV